MTTNAVEMRGVIKRRRGKTIGPVNLALPEGFIAALVGKNGSGKSTLLRLLLKLIQPDEGEILWYGSPSSGELPLELRRRIAYVPELPGEEEGDLLPAEAARFRSHWYPDWDSALFTELMEKFEVPAATRLGKMSKGERRKYELAAALASSPRLLLLDEPSSGLDPFAWKTMIEALQAYIERRRATILISTHLVEEVRRLADYIVPMDGGRLLGMAEKDALFAAWARIWVQADGPEELAELEAELPGLMEPQMEGEGMASFVAANSSEIRKRLDELGVKVKGSRSLELEEILGLWIKGHEPAGLNSGEGLS
ncbi:ABC transporter ATP-binding protein [Paenibacillus spiritus]|uniref:ABC transporter ATP-binding protein n=1 Tax=Paenibacillus spiritus TaxID=2496557 RepID=A0A5J5FV10_9BACL|nr:ABC transporter ATP-binding protein [Paenibacillus spiritus]KAA8997217.1 ABC transporter ATP-binding protein [Paenibacillus spiritus]